MIADKKLQETETKKRCDFKTDGIYLSIIQFVSNHLPLFSINRKQIDQNNIEESYNNQLSMFFNAKLSNEVFQFQHEYQRLNSRKPDIGVPIKTKILQAQYDSIFDIECKRLNSNLKNTKQYISGNTGGIERFKRNLHGTDLPYSAMIGYIENKTAICWVEKINVWIDEQIFQNNKFWTRNEHLSKTKKTYFKSTHYRINSKISNSIELYHFFYII